MTGLYVTIPVACFRKGLAREYLETEEIPPPSTCYGFLLSLVGEADRNRHVGARVTSALLRASKDRSVVLRTVWRVKKMPLGSSGNTRPDYQQLLTDVAIVVWLDSSEEQNEAPTLESRVETALTQPGKIDRFGGLSLGESTHLVDEVKQFMPKAERTAPVYLLQEKGRLTLPVWVDHVGSAKTRYVTGDLCEVPLVPPELARIPQIRPLDG